MVLEEKNSQNPFNEDTVPHSTFFSSAYVKGLSRVLTPIVSWKAFPVTWKNLPKSGIHSQVKTEKSALCILSFRSNLLVFFKSLYFPFTVFCGSLQKAILALDYLLSTDTKKLLQNNNTALKKVSDLVPKVCM